MIPGGLNAMMLGSVVPFVFNQVISAHTQNYNLKAAAIAAGWNQLDHLIASVTLNSGIYIGSASPGSYAFDTGSGFTADTKLSFINAGGFVVGAGGNGGDGAYNYIDPPALAPQAGGPALRAQFQISVDNTGGTIGGGGGGAGGGAGANLNSGGGGGGGGQGYSGGAGGAGGAASASGFAGTSGGTTSVGSGGAGGYDSGTGNTGGTGGNGGGLGSAGQNGSPGSDTTANWGYGAAGGAAIVGNSNITWVATGTRLGAIT